MATRHLIAWLTVVAALLSACRPGGDVPPAPTPSPSATSVVASTEPDGLRIGVVLPLEGVRPLGPDAVRAAVGDLRVATRDEVREYRVLQPDGPLFVADLVALLADQGYDLVCAVGPGAVDAVLPVAVDHPELRFCALPSAPVEGAPANLQVLDVRADHAAYVAGAAAGGAIAQQPDFGEDPPSALQPGVVGDPSVVPPGPQTAAFQAGLRRSTTREVQVGFADVSDDPEAGTTDRTRAILVAGGEVVYGSAGASLDGLLDGAEGEGLVVALVDPRAPVVEPPPELLASVGIDLQVPLATAVRAVIAGSPADPVTFGAGEGIVTVVPGGAPSSQRATAAGEAALADLGTGRITLP
jgi:basic membrane lipoprotein Med (substrate-binding protein (PBP1-ABC) superfamily)